MFQLPELVPLELFFSFFSHSRKHKHGRRNHLARLDGTTEPGEESTHAKQSHHADVTTRPGEMLPSQVAGASLGEPPGPPPGGASSPAGSLPHRS